MGRFIAGFLVASVLWAGVAVALHPHWIGLGEPELVQGEEEALDEGDEADDEAVTEMRRGRRGRRARSRDDGTPRSATSRATPRGEATAGDDLGENDPRIIDGAGSGGEQQLRSSEIEAAIDQVFPRIRRCLVLVEGEGEVTGRLVLRLRIEGSGRVTRVQLRGPAAVTTGEPGSCIQTALRSMQLRRFDGPDMFVDYPINLS
ncbi:MAG: hypothetical protein KF901_23315 [Myxococcales bacterium]|nr:hypothetical protein [Myxococcales bacterium]